MKEKITKRPTLKTFIKAPATANYDGLKASFNIALNIAKNGKPPTIGEDIIIPAIKNVFEMVPKQDSGHMLKCISLSARTVSRRIDEMSNDVENTLGSELQHSIFSIKLDDSTVQIFMAYVRYNSPRLKCIIDEFLSAKCLTADSKGVKILRCLEDYLNKWNVPMENITTVVTDGAPEMTGRHRGFASLYERKGSKCANYSLCIT